MIVLDIETIPNPTALDYECSLIKPPKNYKDQDKIQAYMERQKKKTAENMALKDSAIIKLVGLKTSQGIFCFSDFRADSFPDLGITCFPAESQEKLFENVAVFLSELGKHEEVVAFNGYNFDLPKIRLEMARHNISKPECLMKTDTDLMYLFSKKYSTNTNPYTSVSTVAQKLGILKAGKIMSGARFGDLLNRKLYNEAILYNSIDLILEELIAFKIMK